MPRAILLSRPTGDGTMAGQCREKLLQLQLLFGRGFRETDAHAQERVRRANRARSLNPDAERLEHKFHFRADGKRGVHFQIASMQLMSVSVPHMRTSLPSARNSTLPEQRSRGLWRRSLPARRVAFAGDSPVVGAGTGIGVGVAAASADAPPNIPPFSRRR